MPKGAVLHLHYDSSVSLEWLISYATYLPYAYMYTLENNSIIPFGTFKFFNSNQGIYIYIYIFIYIYICIYT